MSTKAHDPASAKAAADLYRSGKTLTETAKLVGYCPQVIRRWIVEQGVFIRPRPCGRRAEPYDESRRETVLALARTTQMTKAEIARRTGVSRNAVSRWCRAAGLGLHRSTITDDEAHRMLDMYVAGHSATDVAQAFGRSEHAVLDHVRRLGGTVRPRGRAAPIRSREQPNKAA